MLPPPPDGLRHWRPSDARYLLAAWSDPDIARWNAPPARPDEHLAIRWIERAEQRWHDRGALDFAIPGERDEAVGEVSIVPTEGQVLRAEVGIWLLPQARGVGSARQALASLVDWATERDDVEQLWARVDTANEPATALFSHTGWHALGRSGTLAIWATPVVVLR